MIVTAQSGGGLINTLINKFPYPIHLPGYKFCGPFTKIEDILSKNIRGINPLDEACKEHDLAYVKNKDLPSRHEADRILIDQAWNRVKASDSSIGEKIAAYAVTNAIKAKVKLGAGMKKSREVMKKEGKVKNKSCPCNSGVKRKTMKRKVKNFRDALRAAKAVVNTMKNKNLKTIVPAALRAAKKVIGAGRGKINIKTPRIIPLPKSGGSIPFLVPLFAGLSAVGSLAGGASSVYKAIKDIKSVNKEDKSSQIAIKKGKGLYLKPYKQGMGIFLEKVH